jgi:hypothetical protein
LPRDEARIAAVKVRYVVQPDGRRIGLALLEVESPAAGSYPLIIPNGIQLLHLIVDGVPIDYAPERFREFGLPILVRAPRSRVEVLFEANPRTPNETLTSKSQMTFPAPRIGDLPVERTTWTIAALRGFEPIPAEDEDSAASDLASSDDAGDLAGEWRQLAATSGRSVSYTLDGSPDSITVGFRQTDTSSWTWRLAAAFIVTAVLLVAFLRSGLLVDWVRRWPNTAGVILGIAWWLWASPSALGLAIVAAILARQVFIRLRHSRGIRSGSVVPSPSGRGPG